MTQAIKEPLVSCNVQHHVYWQWTERDAHPESKSLVHNNLPLCVCVCVQHYTLSELEVFKQFLVVNDTADSVNPFLLSLSHPLSQHPLPHPSPLSSPSPYAGLTRCPGNSPNCAVNKGSRGFLASREVVPSAPHPDLLKPCTPPSSSSYNAGDASLVSMALSLEIWRIGMAAEGKKEGREMQGRWMVVLMGRGFIKE